MGGDDKDILVLLTEVTSQKVCLQQMFQQMTAAFSSGGSGLAR